MHSAQLLQPRIGVLFVKEARKCAFSKTSKKGFKKAYSRVVFQILKPEKYIFYSFEIFFFC